MKRRKVAMLMAVLMIASSLSGSYVSAASIEDMEVTAEEIAVQSQETESEVVQMATEGTELPTEEALVLEKTETIQAEMKTESASPEVAESEISVPKRSKTLRPRAPHRKVKLLRQRLRHRKQNPRRRH